ncbi:uncharacterized protein LOC9661667 isoform X1 [Selaginella moellendorffii]|uniref:uncharacterized protein LOC9661667 isoform X1 n=1 Tax=Selaginella moellendorffii TaxID=88036 RepID=UPI000D1D0AB0|nr:uncharacterized protein LOC9661667 isoform X1 [Selaginella moellendorffii]|eukprot:XP_024543435.1 uncharacterized protein LOC9661667 isoform X1 [Selaginella moellendorffii]
MAPVAGSRRARVSAAAGTVLDRRGATACILRPGKVLEAAVSVRAVQVPLGEKWDRIDRRLHVCVLARLWSTLFDLPEALAWTTAHNFTGFFLSLYLSSDLFVILASQIYLTALNGGVLALALLLWGKSLQACGPVRTVLAEYTGAMLGAASTLVLGRGGHKWKKGGGLAAMLVAFYVLFRGWTIASLSPFSAGSSDSDEQGRVGLGPITMSIAAGTLFALRRIVARRVSIKATMKKRLHSITVAAATCFLFPFAMLQLSLGQETSPTTEAHGSPAWAYMSTIVFGMVAGFYVDNYAEERLHILATSSEHLLVTSVLLIVLELVIYQMDFSLVGFLICSSLLGLGIYESTSSEKLPSEIVSSTPPM